MERGWTQKQVADRIGAPLPLNISRWENGTTFPSAYYIERLCQIFDKSIRELGLSQLEDEVQAELVPSQTALFEQHFWATDTSEQEKMIDGPLATSEAHETQQAHGAELMTYRHNTLPLPLSLPDGEHVLDYTTLTQYTVVELFRLLSVFIGGCTLDAADAIYMDLVAYDDQHYLLDTIASLISKSLVHTSQQGSDSNRSLLIGAHIT
jgi:transcriptional regulator with XRE-family HTH domain